jgi:hypothetical protein
MLVTGSERGGGGGGIQLRDITVDDDNCTAFVSEECMLYDTLASELENIGYSGNADAHVRNFIYGLFGKSDMRLFRFGSQQWRKQSVTGHGKTI